MRLTLVILLLGFSYGHGDEQLEPKIVGGSEATPHEFPWAVRIQYTNSGLLCGGTIIQDDIILTAAHCLWDLSSLSSIEVVAGEHDVNKNEGTEQTRRIKYGLVHKLYAPAAFTNDIALLVLTSKFNMTNAVRLARLPRLSDPPTSMGQAVGWGTLRESSTASRVLMKVFVPLVDITECSNAYAGMITNNMICYGVEGKDSCQGDSGGALVCGNGTSSNACGIVSFGNGCGRRGYPGVYTKVSNYISWIDLNRQRNDKDCNCKYLPNDSPTVHNSISNNSALMWLTIGFIATIVHS